MVIESVNNNYNSFPSNNLPTPPEPPSSPSQSEAQTYLWSTLLDYVVTNQVALEQQTGLSYAQLVGEIQTLYAQASETTDPTTLSQIVQKAYQEIGGGAPLSPAQQQAAQDIAEAEQEESGLEQQIDSLSSQIGTLQGEIAALQQELATDLQLIQNDPSKAKYMQDYETAKNDLNALSKQLSGYYAQFETLNTALQGVQSDLGTLKDLQTQIDGTTDPHLQDQLLSQLEDLLNGSYHSEVTQTLAGANSLSSVLQTFSLANVTAEVNTLNSEVQPTPPPPPAKGGDMGYVDFDAILGNIWTFIHWQQDPNPPYDGKEVFDTKGFEQYLQSMFSQLAAAGDGSIDFAFAQINQIDDLASGDLNAIWPGVMPANVDTGGQNLLQMFVTVAHQSGLAVNMSFGGQNSNDYNICGPGETPAGQAAKLANFMNSYGIDGIDFDIENGGFSNANQAQGFFTSLYNQITPEGKTSTLTVEGNLNAVQPGGSLYNLFYNEDGQSIFNQMFTGLNLMLYNASTQYYIDANNPSWGIEEWLDIIGKENAGKLHIGFDDAIPYASSGAHAGGASPYKIDTDDNGTAAAEIFEQLQEQLIQDGYTTPLGDPFWWPDNGSEKGTSGRYAPIENADGSYSCNFATEVEMLSFYKKLHELE